MSEFSSSSKLEKLVAALQAVKKKSPDHKSIIFSQYVNFLDIVEWRLKQLGFRPVKLVGTLAASQRNSMLRAFKTNPEVDVMLLSLRAGGEGLNLQCASHVMLLDPWVREGPHLPLRLAARDAVSGWRVSGVCLQWNPAVEMQAIQRAHRIGQTRAVEAIRFCTEGTIEANSEPPLHPALARGRASRCGSLRCQRGVLVQC